jgi:hypothetical protein
MPTRQQRRAKARAPLKKKRRGSFAFVMILTAMLILGGFAAAVFRAKPQPITRGAIAGDHWHADYRIEICGKKLQPYPTVEGQIHTHGDGRIHIHPSSAEFANQNANLRAFFTTVETELGRTSGKNFIRFPNGQKFEDGNTCPPSTKPQKLEVTVNGKTVQGDPGLLVMHDKDIIVVRFGPKAVGEQTSQNPLATASPTPRPATPKPASTPTAKPAPTATPKR